MNGRQALSEITAILEQAEVFDPKYEAGEIVREICKAHPLMITNISENQLSAMKKIAEKRAEGYPLQYIFGKWEFYGYEFFVGEGVLIPRPETELLVDIAVKRLNKNSVILDLCSGTGCIPVSCAKEIGCKAYAVELYDKAFSYLQKNIAHNNADVTAVKGDALYNSHFDGVIFDAIFSNPPYLTRDEMNSLQREVRHEPETALFGGDDGLYFYKQLFSLWKSRLKKDGIFAVEVGDKQAEAVRKIMENEGFSAEIVSDYQGIERVVIGTFQAPMNNEK